MDAAERLQILEALPPSSGVGGPKLESPRPRPASAVGELWPTFQAEFEKLGGQMISLGKLVPKLVGAYVDPDAAALLEMRAVNPNVWEAELGVTTAVLAVAETGTLLLASGEGRARLASLTPPNHVVLVRKSDIVATLQEAIDRMPHRNCVLISGPSRTADIEGVLVRGVHGPKEISVCLIG